MLPIIQKILHTLPKGSWCTEFKAIRMAELVIEFKPEIAVEIGVFRGDTLFVIAQAMRHNEYGKVYGIDPWDNAAAIEGMDVNGPSFAWWKSANLEAVYREAKLKMRILMLDKQIELIRARSDAPDVLPRFVDGSIGFFHLDGNHGREQCLADAKNWLPKLSRDCIIFFDDASWVEAGVQTTMDGLEYLLDNGCEIYEPMIADCAILRKMA